MIADRLGRRLALHLLGRTRDGELTLVEDGTERVFGQIDPAAPLRARLEVHDPSVYRALLRGSLGLALAYTEGAWSSPDPVALVRLGARNMPRFDALRLRMRWALGPVQWLTGLARRNTIRRSRRQIAAHYDLGNDLYRLFLDETLMYSAAVFETPQASLHEASVAKLDRVCRKLQLRPEDHLLEIGTGWGAMAVHAAREYGCRVTTTTISAEQHAVAVQRVREAGLEERVTVLLRDYRELEGTFDKLVSIEMIEAVGWRDFETFFSVCSERLKPDGVMLLQAITIADRAYEAEKATKSFINQLIFPGGCLPSQEVIARCVARATDLRAVQLEDITEHYVRTLQHWRRNFSAEPERLRALGYDDAFQRLWTLYLAYCEGGFAERRIQDVQLLLAKPRFAGEPLAHAEPLATGRFSPDAVAA
ncbi:MAG: class I SAM-dependent methyltransferase [Solirubrobacteraceae bacterium]|nr:class I SAM-dependent methyltransferase [Solirubrobacteraceae bacterium]